MPPTLEEAVNFLKITKIEESLVERIAEMLVTKMEDPPADEKICESIWVILTEAGRSGKITESLGESETEVFVKNAYQKIRGRLEAQLRTIRWSYNEIVDFDVKVSKTHKSSLPSDQCRSKTLVTLKILPAGSTEIETCHVDFNEAQLEEFIWKLQEAMAMRQRLQKRAEHS